MTERQDHAHLWLLQGPAPANGDDGLLATAAAGDPPVTFPEEAVGLGRADGGFPDPLAGSGHADGDARSADPDADALRGHPHAHAVRRHSDAHADADTVTTPTVVATPARSR